MYSKRSIELNKQAKAKADLVASLEDSLEAAQEHVAKLSEVLQALLIGKELDATQSAFLADYIVKKHKQEAGK